MFGPFSPGGYGGDLYDADMGDDVYGGNVQFDYLGRRYDHHSVYGYGRHFSWDSDEEDTWGVHGWEHGDEGNVPW